jgi:hypothetical protein
MATALNAMVQLPFELKEKLTHRFNGFAILLCLPPAPVSMSCSGNMIIEMTLVNRYGLTRINSGSDLFIKDAAILYISSLRLVRIKSVN